MRFSRPNENPRTTNSNGNSPNEIIPEIALSDYQPGYVLQSIIKNSFDKKFNLSIIGTLKFLKVVMTIKKTVSKTMCILSTIQKKSLKSHAVLNFAAFSADLGKRNQIQTTA